MSGRLTSITGYYGARDEKIEKMFEKRKIKKKETVSSDARMSER